MAWLGCRGCQPVANATLPNATAYHRDMPDGPHRIDWEWEEIVLACDLVEQNGWRQLDASDPRVRELSSLLQRMSMHPLEARLPSFRNAAGVARKTYNIATVHPDYVGPPSNGNKLDKKVLDEFRRAVMRLRAKRAALTSGRLTVIGARASSNATTWSRCIKPANALRPFAILLCSAATVIA
jgi:hypothetical protein